MTPKRFRGGSKRNGSVYWAKWHVLSISSLKQDYPTVVSYLKLKALFDQPQLHAKNKPAIRSFQGHSKTNVIWLSSKGCRPEIGSIDNITKPVIRLPHYLRKKFYKEFKGNDIDEKKVDFLKYSHSLDERLSEGHNQLH